MSQVKKNDKVIVHYKGSLSDGTPFDSSEGKDPLEFTVGSGEMIKGFDDAMIGMKPEEIKTVTIPAEEAYGPKYDDLIQEVSKDVLDESIEPEIGMMLNANDDEGNEVEVMIIDVSDNSFTVDGNHPLAGQDLVFEIQLLSIV